jgi:hypothetical protein
VIPSPIKRHRALSCGACKTPCANAANDAWRADPCASCPLPYPAWPSWDCTPGSPTISAPKLGDRIAVQIQSRILDKARPYAPGIVAAIERCGGCKADRRALNGGGLLPGEGAGPPVV